MAYYVMLNFEDADPNAGTGAAARLKLKHLPTSNAVGSAASGTARIYGNRALARSTVFKKRQVVFYPCQEILLRDENKTLDRTDVDNIRRDCEEAKTIGIIIHGAPSDTDHGFSTAGASVCTWKDLGRLMLLLLPDTRDYNVALIMCYAARSDDSSLNHDGHIPASELKTSFAYKFFRNICRLRRIKMTAWTGAVSNDADINHTVETEEQVMMVLQKQQSMSLRNQNKTTMEQARDLLLLKHTLTVNAFDKVVQQYAMSPNLPTKGEVEDFAKQFVIYSPYVSHFITNSFDSQKLGNKSKYGKLVYTFNGGVLEIIARYQTSVHGANYSLYSGPLL